ncbi:MAG: FAD-dependent oxidoreductase [Syntrophobacterales bacterium]|nr:FAD-dependent oxidoreductase [Syntrophobacterales bacterium]
MALITPLTRATSSRILVVGGGIAGLQAALDLAELGFPVTLAEQGPSVGGLMAQLDKTFPTHDCAMCILSPRMLEVARHPLIEILTLTRLATLTGEPGDFIATLSRRPRYVVLERCSGCGECTRVCPRSLPDPFNLGLSRAKAIRVPFPQAVPQAAVLDPGACRHFQGRPCRACVEICPAGAVDLSQEPETLVRRVGAVLLTCGLAPAPLGDFPGATLPGVLTSLQFERLLSATGPTGGRVVRPGDGAPIRRLGFLQCVGSREPERGAPFCSSHCCLASLKEAVLAAELGPPGLESVIFAMDLRAPGKGQEAYLERALARGVRVIRSRAAAVEPRPNGGVAVLFTDLHGRRGEMEVDLAVLALGQRPAAAFPELARRLGLPLGPGQYSASPGVEPWETLRPGIWVGGAAREPGDITDSLLSAAAGAQAAATLLALAPRPSLTPAKMPPPAAATAGPPRIGVYLCHCGTNIAKTIDLSRLAEHVRGLPGVVWAADPLFACSADATRQLAQAIGEHHLTRVVVAACTPRTHEAVFREVLLQAGLNPGFLCFANLREQCAWVHQNDPEGALQTARDLLAMAVRRAWVVPPLEVHAFPVIPRALVIGGGPAGLTAALALADQGFHTYVVEREAQLGGMARRLSYTLEGTDPRRLLQDLEAAAYGHPNVEILTGAQVAEVSGQVGRFRSRVRRQGGREVVLEHGVVLLATGGREFRPEGRFGYGQDPRVLTQLELEERLAGEDPELHRACQVVMLQCVGSREPGRPWCSRLCCSHALKNAILLKRRRPGVEITVLYRDLRAYGRREVYYQEARELGVQFLPYDPGRPPEVSLPRKRPLRLRVWSELLQREITLTADLVVLSAGVEPHPGGAEAARLVGTPLSPEGFLQEAHAKLRPVETVVEGVFLCGLAHSPRSLEEALTQAEAAALKAAALLARPAILSGELYARVEEAHCRRCLTCMGVCPYHALRLGPTGRPQVVLEACRGCGLCATVCPARAISLSRATETEILAQITAILEV